MKAVRYKSLKNHFAVVIGITVVLIIGVLVLFNSIHYRSKVLSSAEETTKAVAEDYAAEIEAKMSGALYSARTLAQSFSVIREERSQVNSLLQIVLIRNKEFIGTFSLWEPNEFDQMDSAYIGQPGHDHTGRFIPYWMKNQRGQVYLQALIDYEDENTGKFYHLPKQSLKEAVIGPYLYPVCNNKEMIVSLVAPIKYENNFYGVAGVNLRIDWLQQMADSITLYNGESNMQIISNNGTIVAATGSDTIIGTHISLLPDIDSDQLLTNLSLGSQTIDFSEKQLMVNVPVVVGETETPWMVRISVPASIIYAEANAKLFLIIFSGIIVTIISIIFIIYYSGKQLRPLRTLVLSAQDLAYGDIDASHFNKKMPANEIGQVYSAFKNLVAHLHQITEVTSEISEGKFGKSVEVISESDILGKAINKMKDTLQKSRKRDKERQEEIRQESWIRQGLTEFSDILRSHTENEDELARQVVKQLVKYMGLNQAGLFVYNNGKEAPHYKLTATYAYNRHKYLKKYIKPGEGLVGACAMEKELIYLADIPEDYLEIESGLGGARPKSLVICPLVAEEEVLGIIEMASFRSFEKYHITFLEKLSESIGSSLALTKINLRTKSLLAQSQQQTEKLAIQEKRMRKSVEKLQIAQEESAKKELEMTSILNAIKSTALVAEFDVNGMIIDINEKFARLFNQSPEFLKGKQHAVISDMGFDKEEYKLFWNDLKNGIEKQKNTHIKLPKGCDLWLSEYFTPILDKNGNAYKILNIAVNMTKSKRQANKLLQQANELQRKEKSLRQTMRDMEAMQEVIKSKASEMSGILRAVDNSLMLVEYDVRGKLITANDNYLNTMGYTLYEVKGTNVRSGVPKERLKKFEKIWQNVCKGIPRKGIITLHKKNGQPVKLLMSDTPVVDSEGNVTKILFLAANISNLSEYQHA